MFTYLDDQEDEQQTEYFDVYLLSAIEAKIEELKKEYIR